MSTEGQAIAHLAQPNLKGDDQAMLARLTEWLHTARFEEQGDEWEVCTEKELPVLRFYIISSSVQKKGHYLFATLSVLCSWLYHSFCILGIISAPVQKKGSLLMETFAGLSALV